MKGQANHSGPVRQLLNVPTAYREPNMQRPTTSNTHVPNHFQRNAPVRESVRSYASSATLPEDESAQREIDEKVLDGELSTAYASFEDSWQSESLPNMHNESLSIDLGSDLESTASESEYQTRKEDQDRLNNQQRSQSIKPLAAKSPKSNNVDASEDLQNYLRHQLSHDFVEVELENELMSGIDIDMTQRLPTADEVEAVDILNHIECEKRLHELEGPVERKRDRSYYFNDGMRVIDLILAYQPKLRMKNKDSLYKEMLNRQYRKIFEEKLEDVGLELEREGLEKSQDGKTCFTKIHATWEFLCRQAEIQQIKVPLAPMDLNLKEEKNGIKEKAIKSCFGGVNPFRLSPHLVPQAEHRFTARFDSTRKGMFMIENEQTFFTTTQRIRMVWDTIQRITVLPIKQRKMKGFKLRLPLIEHEDTSPISFFRLQEQKIYTAAFPIHDSECKYPKTSDPYMNDDSKVMPERYWLYHYWGNFLAWRIYQPLDEICDYFGVRVGLYFAWLGFYTNMLYLPALIGLLCLIYGVISVVYDHVVETFCDEEGWGNVTMCRLCPTKACPYMPLHENCGHARISHVFDNYSTVFFALFISIWAILFLEQWKRRQAELAARWDAADQEFNDVVVRAQYQLRVNTKRVNVVTQEEEPFVEDQVKQRRLVASIASVTFFILVVVTFMVALIMYRIVCSTVYAKLDSYFITLVSPNLLTSITASLINAIIIFILSVMYQKVARALTEHEYPRTDAEYDVSYTYKVFAFQFMNYYGSLFYLALLKGKFNTGITDLNQLTDQCGYSGCMADVCIQLIIIMSGKQILNNVGEVIVPTVKNYVRKIGIKDETEENEFSRWERDYILNPVPTPSGHEDYLEMIIQYGFLVMFAAAFPLAAVFALLNNIMEIRIDANKQLTEYRRPIPERVADIGPWFPILELLTKLAVITNALVIAFTSDFIDRAVYTVFYKPGPINGSDYFLHTFTKFNPTDYFEITDPDYAAKLISDHGVNVTECWYKGYYSGAGASDQYERTILWWQVLAARLAFVILFEHVVFFVQSIIQNIIPDVPEHVTLRIERERHVTKTLFMQQEFGGKKYKRIYDESNHARSETATLHSLPESTLSDINTNKKKFLWRNVLSGKKGKINKIMPVPGANSVTSADDVRMLSNRPSPRGRKRPWYITLFNRFNLFC